MVELSGVISQPVELPIPAGTTFTDTARLDVGVLWRKLMASKTVRLAGTKGTRAYAAQDILPRCDCFQMVRVHAATVEARRGTRAARVVVADVIKVESVRHGANQQLVSSTMSAR
jgi:hypothetical protein